VEILIEKLVRNLGAASKPQQILHLNTLKDIIHNYIVTEEDITRMLVPNVSYFADFLSKNHGNLGIQVSAFLSILVPVRYSIVSKHIVNRF
jgi:hypothetical protein